MTREIDDSRTYHFTQRKDKLIMSMELRGMKQKDIAEMLSMDPQNVYNATRRPSYQAEFMRRLTEADDDFLRFKPRVVAAVGAGLDNSDPAIGLRSAELWFKAMGYKGFGKGDPQADRSVTAEDIAAQLLAVGGGRITIDVQPQAAPPSEGGLRTIEGDSHEISQGQEISPDD